MISPDLQKELGIKISALFQQPVYVCAEFVYMGEKLKISRWSGSKKHWQLQRNSNFLCGGEFDVFLSLLLLELGKIRASFVDAEPESMTASEILQKFNQYYVEIEAIAQSQEWLELCLELHNDPEMKTHLGDVLHYLSEAMGCVENVSKEKFTTKVGD